VLPNGGRTSWLQVEWWIRAAAGWWGGAQGFLESWTEPKVWACFALLAWENVAWRGL
jgi:hypothetical protein